MKDFNSCMNAQTPVDCRRQAAFGAPLLTRSSECATAVQHEPKATNMASVRVQVVLHDSFLSGFFFKLTVLCGFCHQVRGVGMPKLDAGCAFSVVIEAKNACDHLYYDVKVC